MRWVRSKMRYGAWCALFALTLQFVLLFGHVNRGEITEAFGSLSVSAAASDPPAAASDAPAIQSRPSRPGSDYCAYCSVISLVSSIVRAAAPALPLPVVLSSLRFWTIFDVASALSAHLLFEARAPPVA
jgi:Protein of unknown function (DUF2946)